MQRRAYGFVLVALAVSGCQSNGNEGPQEGEEVGSGLTMTGLDASGATSEDSASTTDGGSTGAGTTDDHGGSGTGTASAGGTSTAEGDSAVEGGCDPFCDLPKDPDFLQHVCGESDFMLQFEPPNVMLVLDKSGSMVKEENKWDPDGAGPSGVVTRWHSLQVTVEAMVEAYESRINFGMLLFPILTDPVDMYACTVDDEVDVPVAAMNADEILAVVPPNDADGMVIYGSTPTRKGIALAATHLKTLDPAVPRAIFLITDGAANCPGNGNGGAVWNTYDDELPIVVEDTFMDGIPTYVVGIDIKTTNTGTNAGDGDPNNIVPFDKMNEVADAGGVPKMDPANPTEHFYQANNQIELDAALEAIAAQIGSCVVPLDPEPDDPTMLQIQVGGMVVPPITDCATESGWLYVDAPPYNTIELCGTWCDEFKIQGDLLAKYGCSPDG